MTALLWEAALLLLGAYFLGAFAGCLIRRTLFALAPAEPARTHPAAEAAMPVYSDDPAPIAAAAAPPSGDLGPASEQAFAPRVVNGGETADAVADQTTPEPELPVEAEPAIAASAAPTDAQPTPPDHTSSAGEQERPARSIGTSAAAAAALAAATARHQAAQAAARARAEAQRDSGGPSLPAAGGTTGLASTTPPRVHAPASVAARTGAIQPVASSSSDDLARIRGIDGDLHQRLEALGVRRFSEIAAWRKDDVRRISLALGFRGRIEQENWIEQAQVLMSGAETAFSRKRAGMKPLASPSPDQGEHRPISVTSPATAAAAQARRPVAGLGRENLQRIGRITPDIERLLNVQGVSRYEQIAHWSTSDVGRFEQLLGGDGRISRENWIEQAHILARGGETAYSRDFDRQATVPSRPRPTQLAEAIRAAQAEETAKPGEHDEQLEAAPPTRVDLNALRSVRSEALRSDTSKDTGMIGPGPQTAARPDDLKRIRGIGVLLEKRLNAMGYRTYEQVANWTAADVDRVGSALDIRGRIERENWVEQARILASGERTEFARRLDRGEVPVSRAVD